MRRLKNGKYKATSSYGNTTGQGDTPRIAQERCMKNVGKKLKKLEESLGFKVNVM